jgi:hypothetical protein
MIVLGYLYEIWSLAVSGTDRKLKIEVDTKIGN